MLPKYAFWLIFAIAAPASADFQAGLGAYDSGDYATALKEWQPIAERGDANAEYNVGLLYTRGKGMPQDFAKAAEWYRKAAEQGVAAAEYNLGLLYANGQGVAKDPEEAARWLQKAAEHGVKDAEINLADLYSETQGPSRNYAEAAEWYRKAAEQGNLSAAFNLGLLYDMGQGVPQDYAEAIKWYRRAADGGYAPAMTNLGILYYNEQGVKRDLVQAWAWFARAFKLGDARASELLVTTGERMKKDEVAKARQLADSWQPPAKPPETKLDEAVLFKQPQRAPSGPADASSGSSGSAEREQSDVRTGVDRIVAVGDFQGDLDQFRKLLQSAELIDGHDNWTGGKAHLVQTGNVVGTGGGAIMDLLIRLKKQAEAAGGGVHVLAGDHEGADIKIDRTLFVYAGTGSKDADWTSLVTGNETQLEPMVDQLLKRFEVDRIVIGHTSANPAITPRFHRKVILIDTGNLACLEIDQRHAYALDRGQGLELPADENGPDMLRYLRQAAALDPQPSPIQTRIDELLKHMQR